jgi:deazaflavin-dependent oxidoreductase (nitroreductase family)
MHFPHFMRRVNRVFTNPLMRTFAWLVPPLAVVHHVGRKSGRQYRNPVVAFPSRNGFVIPMTYGRDVDWARNIVRAHGCELERMGRRVALRNPRIVGIEEASRHLPSGVRTALKAANLPGYVLLQLGEKTGSKGTAKRHSTASRRRS